MSANRFNAPPLLTAEEVTDREQSITATLQTLSCLKSQVSPLDLVLSVLSSEGKYAELRDSMLKRQSIVCLFEALVQDEKGRDILYQIVQDIVMELVDLETKAVTSRIGNENQHPILLGHEEIRSKGSVAPLLKAIIGQAKESMNSGQQIAETTESIQRSVREDSPMIYNNLDDMTDSMELEYPSDDVSSQGTALEEGPIPLTSYWVDINALAKKLTGGINEYNQIQKGSVDSLQTGNSISAATNGGSAQAPRERVETRETPQFSQVSNNLSINSGLPQSVDEHEPVEISIPTKKSRGRKRTITRPDITSLAELPETNASNSYPCAECPKVFKVPSSLRDHMHVHMGIKPYRCAHPSCSKCFTHFGTWYLHYRSHGRAVRGKKRLVAPFPCTLCPKTFKGALGLSLHMNTHTGAKSYKCTHFGCPREFNHQSNWYSHRRSHLKESKVVAVGSLPLYLSPEESGESQAALESPMGPQTPESNRDKESVSMDNIDTVNHSALASPTISPTNGTTTQQLVNYSTENDDRGRKRPRLENVIDFRPKDFGKEGSLSFTCKLCPKVFRYKISLKDHINTHTGAKPYACTKCSRAYTHYGSLHKHKSTHPKDP